MLSLTTEMSGQATTQNPKPAANPDQPATPPVPAKAGVNREAISPVSVEASPQLFAVFCAAQAAGFEDEVPDAALTQLRRQLRAEIRKGQGPAHDALRSFYGEHELPDPGATISRYVSFALVVASPPRFEYAVEREQIPPDALALEGFADILKNYYQEAGIERLYARAQPAYDTLVRTAERTVAQITLEETAYVREILRPSEDHTFKIYVEPMAGARSQFRNYGGRYALVIDAQRGDSAADEIRHSLLHFLLDKVALEHRPPVQGRKALLDVAARAPRLPRAFREDIAGLTDECLVKAVELRLRHLPAEKAQKELGDAEADGFVLIRTFYNALAQYEKAEDSFAVYYTHFIAHLDLAAEAKRLEHVTFAQAAGVPAADSAPPVTEIAAPPSELEQMLSQAERELANKDPQAAARLFQVALEKYPNTPRAEYGLGVASVVNGEVERGRALLEKVAKELGANGEAAGTDPRTLAWAHVWLGRIQDESGHRQQAELEYRAALAVPGAPDPAKAAAQRGLSGSGPQEKP